MSAVHGEKAQRAKKDLSGVVNILPKLTQVGTPSLWRPRTANSRPLISAPSRSQFENSISPPSSRRGAFPEQGRGACARFPFSGTAPRLCRWLRFPAQPGRTGHSYVLVPLRPLRPLREEIPDLFEDRPKTPRGDRTPRTPPPSLRSCGATRRAQRTEGKGPSGLEPRMARIFTDGEGRRAQGQPREAAKSRRGSESLR